MAVDENFSFVYPPANVPAHTIGPVHLYDTIALSWTPSTLYIAPPYRLQMACLLTNNTYVFESVTNITTPHLWFFSQNYDTQPYSCWWGFMVPDGGKGETGAAFNVVPTTAATAITFQASATSSASSSLSSTSSSSLSTASPSQAAAITTTPAAAATATVTAAVNDPGLSTGAKAGIGVGVAGGIIFLVALVLGLVFLRKRQRRRRALKGDLGPDVSKLHYNDPPLAFVEAEAPYPYVEADSGELRHELHS